MRIYFFFAILITGFFAVITAMVRPDIIENKFWELRAPIDNYVADKNAKTWAEAKDQARAMWMLKHPLPAYCSSARSPLRELECNATKGATEDQFDRSWNEDVRNGWKPQGASE